MDEIKRKLKLIDEQLIRWRFHTRVISTCPLVFVAVGLCTGILVQAELDISVSIWIVMLILSAVTAVSFFSIQQFSGGNYQYVTAYLALACFACLGAIRLTDYGRPTANDIRLAVGDRRKLATIRGTILTEPKVNRNPDWKFSRFTHNDPVTGFYFKIDQVETASGWAHARGTIRVYINEPVPDLRAGDRIQAYCWLDKFSPPSNPGQFDSAGYLARRNVFIGASVKSRAAIRILSSLPAGTLARLRAKAAQAATQALLGDTDDENSGRGLLQALLLGDRSRIDTNTYLAFSKTGLLHFISLSGMHMGILFGLIWWACKIAGFMKPVRAMICATAICVFLLVVPPRAPTLRAAFVCWTFCASLLVRRHYSPINTLSMAAIILVLIRPTQLFEAGWQLSFASVLSLLLFHERLHSYLHEKITDLRRPENNAKKMFSFRMIPNPWPYLLRLLSVGLAAWMGGAGILLYHFYTINLFTSIWTVLVFPLVGLILVVGFLKMILFFLLPTLSGLLGIIAGLLSDALVCVVGIIAKMDPFQILIGRVSIAPIIIYYCLLAFAGYAYIRRPRKKMFICILVSLSLIAYLCILKYQRIHPKNLEMTCLDVGHGQAILARLPGGTNILFDAGSLHRSNVGARIVAPFLACKGISKLDAIIISHNDTDHINGIPEIVQLCEVNGVYANDAFFGGTDQWGTVECLKESLAEQGLKIEPLKKEISSGGAKIETLWPCGELSNCDDLTDNNRSLVSLIEFAGVRILLCSDIEQFAREQLLRLHPDLHADIVIVPHHGSIGTQDETFLKSLNAKILICSCDLKQYERITNDISRANEASTRMTKRHTAQDGAITVTIRKDSTIVTDAFLKHRSL